MQTEANEVEKLLSYDALSHAEKMTGKSYEDDQTGALGLLLHISNNEKKTEVLKGNCDTYRSMPFNEAIEVIESLGFKLIYSETFPNYQNNLSEQFLIYWNYEHSIALTAESYSRESREVVTNKIEVYYNWKPFDDNDWYSLGGSGHYSNGVRIGNNSVLCGLRHWFEKAMKLGTFQKQWIERPFIWFLNFSEPEVKGYSYKSINAVKMLSFPIEVIEAMGN